MSASQSCPSLIKAMVFPSGDQSCEFSVEQSVPVRVFGVHVARSKVLTMKGVMIVPMPIVGSPVDTSIHKCAVSCNHFSDTTWRGVLLTRYTVKKGPRSICSQKIISDTRSCVNSVIGIGVRTTGLGVCVGLGVRVGILVEVGCGWCVEVGRDVGRMVLALDEGISAEAD